jgi:DNA-binding transcriptional regulator YiaG
MGFSDTVKQVRQTLGISQEGLAHALNVSYVTINRWENGRTEPNRMAKTVFYAFCEKKGISTDRLKENGLGGKEN